MSYSYFNLKGSLVTFQAKQLCIFILAHLYEECSGRGIALSRCLICIVAELANFKQNVKILLVSLYLMSKVLSGAILYTDRSWR